VARADQSMGDFVQNRITNGFDGIPLDERQ
jgi:hypothetical protein